MPHILVFQFGGKIKLFFIAVPCRSTKTHFSSVLKYNNFHNFGAHLEIPNCPCRIARIWDPTSAVMALRTSNFYKNKYRYDVDIITHFKFMSRFLEPRTTPLKGSFGLFLDWLLKSYSDILTIKQSFWLYRESSLQNVKVQLKSRFDTLKR